jgi:hypothetical protein
VKITHLGTAETAAPFRVETIRAVGLGDANDPIALVPFDSYVGADSAARI